MVLMMGTQFLFSFVDITYLLCGHVHCRPRAPVLVRFPMYFCCLYYIKFLILTQSNKVYKLITFCYDGENKSAFHGGVPGKMGKYGEKDGAEGAEQKVR